MKNVHIGWGPVGMTRIISRQSKKLQLNKSNHTGILDSVFTLSITSEYEEIPVWQSSNEDVAKVDQNGNVTLVGEGSATITVTSGELVGKCSIEVVLSKEQQFIKDLEAGSATLSESLNKTAIVSNTTKINLNNQSIVGEVFTESNGEMIEGNTDSYAIWVKEGGNLTIEGDGEVASQDATYSMAVWADGGIVTIKGGTFKNEGDSCDLIYASAGGKVYIYGGEFKAAGPASGNAPGTANPYVALNVKDKDYKSGASEIVVYGGRFYGFDPANNLSEGPNTNFVADGYESVEIEPGIWEVSKIESKLDTTKIYYGVINNGEGLYTSFDDITEDMIVEGINQGKINSIPSGLQELIIPISMADIAVILIPTNDYLAYKDNLGTKSPFNEVNTGLNFHANGKQFGNFFIFGEWFTSVDGANLKVYVE